MLKDKTDGSLAKAHAVYVHNGAHYSLMFFPSAWYGIEQADGYLLVFENATEAESTPPAVGASPQNQSVVSNHEYLYWMTGATVSGLVWACINAVTLVALSKLIRTHLALLAKLETIMLEE